LRSGRVWIPPSSPLPRSLSLRGTSGERAGERARSIELAANRNPLSLTLSPLLRRGERELTSGMSVVVEDALLRSHGHKFFLANRRHHLNKSLLFEKRWTLRPSVTAVKCLGTPRESGTVAPL